MNLSIRTCSGLLLKDALQASHLHTLALLRSMAEQLSHSTLAVPLQENLNPPLWEFGHVGWFKEYWTVRNPERHRALLVQASAPNSKPSILPMADALFNSATVPHNCRWQLPLLGVSGVIDYLNSVQDLMLQALDADLEAETSLYFYRLTLAHEWMHQEAFLMAGQEMALDLPGLTPPFSQRQNDNGSDSIICSSQTIQIRANVDEFHFDNEALASSVDIAAFAIDPHPVSLNDFWEFVQDGGYESPALWSESGWDWRSSEGITGPLAVQQRDGSLMQRWGANWRPAHSLEPMTLVSLHEAVAWCNWADRRLPTEAEWHAAQAAGIDWGNVWEWTADAFEPFPGFEPHPYGDYSVPWFGNHWVLKGGSWATHPMLRDHRMRNFYRPHRRDVFAGFRSVVSL